jgi:hypothetical protein
MENVMSLTLTGAGLHRPPTAGGAGTAYNVDLSGGTADNGWSGNTVVCVLAAANLANVSGTQAKVTFQGGSFGSLTTAWIGQQAASGDPYDFANTPAQLLFSGSASITPSSATFTSDWVNLPEAFDNTKTYLVALFFSGGATNLKYVTSTGDKLYYKGGATDGATVNKSGYTLNLADKAECVSKLEIQ